jgi:hypothetical protein
MAFRPTGLLRSSRTAIAGIALFTAISATAPASAQIPGIMNAGDTVVTGFSGVVPGVPPFPSGNPLDETFIDLNGPSLQIQRPMPLAPPNGQLIPSPTVFTARARDVGQVGSITIDDQPQPNIFVAATSIYGVQIVLPDSDGDGRPERIKLGQPGAMFMQGQWGPGGTAGSIYRIDGLTGAISLFTTIGANSGAGIGDIVYDPATRQFFVSDLDTGLIYRLDWTGLIEDVYDHGLFGRPMAGLPPVADDGSVMNIASPAFNAENPATWGYTQPQRRVRGIAAYGGRLYYAVDDAPVPKIFSVGIRLDGSFGDPRWELDVAGLASANPIADIAFDGQGRMILAQRGAQRGSYDYSVFAEPLQSSVVRYRREIPDNPATPSAWMPVPDEYVIGFRPNGRNTTGGIALGLGYDTLGQLRPGACNEYLWTTGESLRESPFFAGLLATGGPATVHGLQGNDIDLVRPVNDPPFNSYFTDYDGQFVDPPAQGHMGDVEIWQPCLGGTGIYFPPYFPPPGYTPPPGNSFNLALDKEPTYPSCFNGGPNWICLFTIRVTNTGPGWYWGPVTVADWLPTFPAGASIAWNPPWGCFTLGADYWQCSYPTTFLGAGDSVDLSLTITLPSSVNLCYLPNGARIAWPVGGGDANPGDDVDFAAAIVPATLCPPPPPPGTSTTDLTIDKIALTPTCDDWGAVWHCQYQVTVTNAAGLGTYDGNIVVSDTLPTADNIFVNAPWMCTNGSPTHTCTYPAAHLLPGQSVFLFIDVYPTKAAQVAAGRCDFRNTVGITFAPRGSPMNLFTTHDDAAATAQTPGPNCVPPGRRSDLIPVKLGFGCRLGEQGFVCLFAIGIRNDGPDAYDGPLTIKDTFVGFTPLPPSPVFFPPICTPDGSGGYNCTTPGSVHIDASTTAGPLWVAVLVPDDGMTCKITNHVQITSPVAPNNGNYDNTNDGADATIEIRSRGCEPIAKLAEALIITCPVERQAPDGMCCPEGQRWNGRACVPVGTQPPVPCPPGTTGTAPNCVPNTCPPGTSGTPPNCLPPPLVQCPPGTTGTYPNCTSNACPPGTTGTPPNCVPNACPPGTTGTPPNCRPIACPQGTTGTYPNCVPTTQSCPPGTTGTPPNCRPLTCPQGTTGTYPNCRPLTCPQGTTGTYPNCVPTTQSCPPGTTGTPPNCRPLTCPQGTTGTYPNCVPTQQSCPPGTTGTPPNCRALTCPQGTTGTPPNCVAIPVRCPTGMTGTPPNCRPATCPQGTTGTPPNCVQIPATCPAGTVGTPPNCRSIITTVPGIIPLQPSTTPQQVPR